MSQSDIVQHVYFVTIFTRNLILKDQFSLFIVAVLLQQLTVYWSSNNNIIIQENVTLYICKHHSVHMSMYFWINSYICVCFFFHHGANPILIYKKHSQYNYGFYNNRSDYQCNTIVYTWRYTTENLIFTSVYTHD